jgi:hypothetical protein
MPQDDTDTSRSETRESRPTQVSRPSLGGGIEDFPSNLWEGNFGLPMTYWVYGVLAGFVWAAGIFALNLEPDSDHVKLIYFLMATYYAAVYVGIWQAANKYTGSKVWAVLAKFVVVIVALPTTIRLIKWLFTD